MRNMVPIDINVRECRVKRLNRHIRLAGHGLAQVVEAMHQMRDGCLEGQFPRCRFLITELVCTVQGTLAPFIDEFPERPADDL